MSRNVSEASNSTEDIARSISGVATASRRTSEGVQESQDASSALARMSADMQELVSRFRV